MAENQNVTPVKHINAKSAGMNPKDCIRMNAPVFMIRIWGVLTGLKNFEDKKSGDLKTSFIGEFMGQGPKGDLYSADKMFCFKALEEKLAASFTSGGEKAIEFAYDIIASPDEKSVTGYVYGAKSVIPTASSDRLSALQAAISDKPLLGVETPKTDASESAADGAKGNAAAAATGGKKGK